MSYIMHNTLPACRAAADTLAAATPEKIDNALIAVADAVEQQAQDFINDLFSTLRERGLELKSGVVVFVGGGSIRLRRQIEASGKVGKALFVDDIQANAKGFEKLYQYTVNGR